MTYAGKKTGLTVPAKPNAELGLIFVDAKKATESITEAL